MLKLLELRMYLKFIVGGSLSTLLNLAITYLLTEVGHVWHMLAFAIALGIEIIFQFLYHSVITFKKKGKATLFLLVILLISDLNWILVYIISVKWRWHYLTSIILAALIISIINFYLNRYLVFRSKNGE